MRSDVRSSDLQPAFGVPIRKGSRLARLARFAPRQKLLEELLASSFRGGDGAIHQKSVELGLFNRREKYRQREMCSIRAARNDHRDDETGQEQACAA